MKAEIFRAKLPNKAIATVAAAAVIAAGITLATYSHERTRSTEVNLLQQDWRYMPGVTRHAGALAVGPTDFKIVHQDGSGGQPNPPVNLYGTHLETPGDFSVSATIADNKGDASLDLYNTPPLIADEFRIEPAGVRLTEKGADLEVQIQDGSHEGDITKPKPVYDEHFNLPNPAAPLTITKSGRHLRISAGKQVITDTDEANVFTSGSVWLGLDSSAGGFKVTKFSASGNNVSVVDTTETIAASKAGGLQELANTVRPDFKVGTAVALSPFAADSAYQQELLGNFGSITPENAMKAQFISPKQGVYDFQEADAWIAIAQKYGLRVHGHNLVFTEAEPAWMRNLPTGTAAERASTASILLDYVRAYMTHFKGKLASIDVSNEPLDANGGSDLQENVWTQTLGPDWLVQVSKLVYSIDPNVKQFVNENGAEEPSDRQDALYNLVVQASRQGAHIYGVGLQAHVYDISTDQIDPADLNDTINRFAHDGRKTRISEMDVTDDAGAAIQAQQYSDIFLACLRNPNCISFTTWGLDNKYDTYQNDDGSLAYGNDLLFDHGRKTSAYLALQRALRK